MDFETYKRSRHQYDDHGMGEKKMYQGNTVVTVVHHKTGDKEPATLVLDDDIVAKLEL